MQALATGDSVLHTSESDVDVHGHGTVHVHHNAPVFVAPHGQLTVLLCCLVECSGLYPRHLYVRDESPAEHVCRHSEDQMYILVRVPGCMCTEGVQKFQSMRHNSTNPSRLQLSCVISDSAGYYSKIFWQMCR